MARRADDHFMTPRRIGKPRVDQRKAGDRFHFVQQVEAPGDREPAQGEGEKQGQQQRQPEYGDREAQQRQGANQGILPFVAHNPRQHANGDPDHQREAEGEDTQLHRGREYLFKLLGDRLPVDAGDAKIPVQHALKPEPPGVPQRGALQRRVRRKIAQAKTDKRQQKERNQQQQQATQGKNNHGFCTSSSFSRETPAKEALPNGLSTRPFMS